MATKEEFEITTPNASAMYLRQLREQKGLTRVAAAEMIGCSIAALAWYERRGINGNMHWSSFLQIVQAYDISAEELIEHAHQPIGPDATE